jgi:hypothetical protein
MPIRRELRPLYPRNWPAISQAIRFGRAGGRCEACARPHGHILTCLSDGRWQDPTTGTWRDRRGKPVRAPDLVELTARRTTRVVLAAAHRDHNPRHNSRRNLRALCQRCHLLHDRRQHHWQRWLTHRRRYAIGDLFLGLYADLYQRADTEKPTIRLSRSG